MSKGNKKENDQYYLKIIKTFYLLFAQIPNFIG